MASPRGVEPLLPP